MQNLEYTISKMLYPNQWSILSDELPSLDNHQKQKIVNLLCIPSISVDEIEEWKDCISTIYVNSKLSRLSKSILIDWYNDLSCLGRGRVNR